ncbi:MAG: DUF4403 family protein [Chitinophagaceae bacterium]
MLRFPIRIFLLVLVVFAGCNTAFKARSSLLPGHLSELEESIIYIPVKIYAKPFLEKAEAMAPVSFTSGGWPAFESAACDFQYKYRFLRSSLSFACTNNKVQVTMLGNYQISGSKCVCAFGKQVSPWISGSCGFAPETMRRIQITIGSELSFEPNGRIVSHSALQRINPLDKCTVTLMNTDITPLISDSIRSSVNAFSSFLDRAVGDLKYNDLIQKIATLTGKKISLAGYGSLKLNTSAIHVGKINLLGDTIYFTAGFRCFPEISSDSINHQSTRFLPPITETNEKEGFRIQANASYEYFFLDSMLSKFARQNPFDLDGKQVRISQVNIRGLDNNRIQLKLQFTGSFKGILYLTGTPKLDEKMQQISVPDLDYSLKSADLVLTMGKTLYNKKIITTLRSKAVLNLNDLFQKNKPGLDSMMSRTISAYVSSEGAIQGIRARGMVVNKDNLLLQLSAQGNLSLSVSPPKKF